MGYWKDYQIEQEKQMAEGYILPEKGGKFLCADHYQNKYLKKYISDNGAAGVCSYCGKHTKVLDLSDFVEYVGGKLADWLEDIDNAGLFLEKSFYDNDLEEIPGYQRASGYIAPDDASYYETNNEVMDDFDLESDNSTLNKDLSSCLYMERKIRRDPTSMILSDELSYRWEQFCRLVKGERRYTFFKSPLFDLADGQNSDNGLSDILSELGGVIHAAESIIPAGTQLFRCRPANNGESVTKFEHITAPPMSAAKTNRLSPVGISIFYGSFDNDTPYKETKNYETQQRDCYYLGSFHTNCDLSVVDLTTLECDFWMDGLWQETLFLKRFHKEITKAIMPEDEEVEYVPSQIFTEYLRYLCKNKEGAAYDGIIYSSSLTSQRNVALFYDNKTSEKVLDLDAITKMV
ncbi:MAG: RES domain-containing protein [Bacteroidales bacterium]|nr:RES domain-containing protein [Bacteroidales bacterium]